MCSVLKDKEREREGLLVDPASDRLHGEEEEKGRERFGIH